MNGACCAAATRPSGRSAWSIIPPPLTSGWIFTPDEKAKVYVVDTEYASYGVWLKRTTDADGVLTYNMVDTFAMGTEATVAVTEVDGTASYKAGLRTRSAH